MVWNWKDDLPDGGALPENSATDPLATLTASNEGGIDALSYSITSHGYGNLLFEIDDKGVLSPTSYLEDYEYNLLDYASESRHFTALVSAHSGEGDVVLSRLFVLTLGDVDDHDTEWVGTPPTGIAINENNPENYGPIVFNANDADGTADVTYSLSGDDAAYFNIDADTGGLFVKSSLDFEDSHGATYSVIITATSTDGSEAVTQLYVLTLQDVNEDNLNDVAAEWIVSSTGRAVPENYDSNILFATFLAADADGGNISYWLSADGGVDHTGLFSLDTSGRLYLTQSFDFEALPVAKQPFYTVVVNARGVDGGVAVGEGLSPISQKFILTIQNAQSGPAWTPDDSPNGGSPDGGNLSEINAIGAQVADFGATDEANANVIITYGIANAGDSKYFAINSTTGALTVRSVFDFENPDNASNRYSVLVLAQANDNSGPGIRQIFVLTIDDNNSEVRFTDAPKGATLAENTAIGFSLVDFDASDPGGAYVDYRLEGADAKYFSINLTGDGSMRERRGELTTASIFDYEERDRYSVIVRINSLDDTDDSIASSLFILTVTDVAASATWTVDISGAELAENTAGGAVLASFNATDQDASEKVVYGLGSGLDSSYFAINSNTGQLGTNVVFDFEDREHYTVLVLARAEAGGELAQQYFVLTITDVSNTTAFTAGGGGLTISENNTVAVSFVATDRIDDFGNAATSTGIKITYDLSGDAADYFSIAASTGWFFITSTLDFESEYGQANDNRYSVVITASADVEGTAITQLFILTLTDVNEDTDWVGEPPASISIAENNPENFGPIVFNATDGDGAAVTYSLSGDDAAYFNIDANTGELRVKSVLNFEDPDHTAKFYNVIITATPTDDSPAISTVYVLSLTDVEDEPAQWQTGGNPTGNAGEVLETIAIDTSVANFGATDPDDLGGEGIVYYGLGASYGFGGGHQDDYFNIDISTGVITTKSELNFEEFTHYTILALSQAAEGNKGVAQQIFVLTLTDVDNTRGWADGTPDGITLSENLAIGVEVYNINAKNAAQGGGGITFGISGTDADYFNIGQNNGVITFASVLDFESDYGQSIGNLYSVIIHSSATIEGTEITRLFVLTITDQVIDWESGGNPAGTAIDENNAENYGPIVFNAVDGDGAAVTYSLEPSTASAPNDAAYFSLDSNTGELRVKSVLDFENPDHDPRYSVVVIATDDADGDATSQTFILTVTDVGDEPTQWEVGGNPTGNAGEVLETIAVDTALATFLSSDPEGAGTAYYGLGASYGVSGGHQDDYFNIDISTGVITTKSELNFEEFTHYTILALSQAAEGNKGVAQQIFILTLTDVAEDTGWVGEPPAGITIDENNPENFGPILFNATDGDGVAVTYSLEPSTASAPNDAAYFNLDANTGELRVKSSLDFENPDHGPTYSVIINANSTDDSAAISTLYVLSLTDVEDEATQWQTNPTGNAGEVLETIAVDTALATFLSSDPEGAGTAYYGLGASYGVSGGHQDDYFNIDISTGVITTKSELNFEEFTHYTILALSQAAEGNKGVAQQIFVLTLTDVAEDTGWVGEPPAGITIDENNPENFGPILFNATDGDGVAVTYSLEPSTASAPNDAAYFNLDANTGELRVKSSLDFEDSHGPTYSVIINATSLDDSAAISTLYVLSLTDVGDEATQWQTGGNPTGNAGEVLETIAIGTSVADFLSSDPEGAGTAYYGLGASYGFGGGHQDDYFNIDISTGVITTKSELNFEEFTHYTILALSQAAEGNKGVAQQIFILTLTDVDNTRGWADGTPDGITLSENLAIGAEVYNINAKNAAQGGGNITFGISGTDADYFNIGQSNGVITFASVLDFENPANADNRYSIIIHSSATIEGDEITRNFILTITDQAVEWESGGNLAGIAIAENNAENFGPIVFNAVDSDGATVTYSLEPSTDTAPNDAAYFSLDANTGELRVKSSLNFEDPDHDPRYSVVVIATDDADGDATSQTFILTVTNVDEGVEWQTAPTGNAVEVLENIAIGTAVANFGATDPEGGVVYYGLGSDYGFAGGHQDAYFNLDLNTGELTTNSVLNFEEFTHYTIVALSQAAAGNKGVAEHTFILTLTDIVNETPQWVGNPSTGIAIAENNPENFGPIVFNATDADGANVAYSLSGDDADYFNFNRNTGELRVKSILDYEDSDHGITYSVIITATNGNAPISTLYVLTVNNVNEDYTNDTATTWVERSSGIERAENIEGGYIAGFSARDDDGPGISYWLSGDDAALFSIDVVGGVYAISSFDHESSDADSKNKYSIVIHALGNAGDEGGKVGDGLVVITQSFVLTVTNINEFGTGWEDNGNPDGDTKAEDIAIGTALATFGATDGDGATVNYSLQQYSNASYFEIDSNGVLTTRSGLDFEDSNAGHYTVIVDAQSDDGSLAISQIFVLTVTNVGDVATSWVGTPPTGIAIAENNAENLGPIPFSAVDGDSGGTTVTYSLSGDDVAYFDIDADTGGLSVKSSLDYEDPDHGPTYSVIVNATSTDGSAISTVYVLTVTNVDEGIRWSDNPSGSTLAENTIGVQALETFVAADSEFHDNASTSAYQLRENYKDSAYFDITSGGVLTTDSTFDFENRTHYTVQVYAGFGSDRIEQDFILTISDTGAQYEPRWSANPNGATIAENNSIDDLAAAFWARDNIDGTTGPSNVSYSLSGADAEYFAIPTGNQLSSVSLTIKSILDYEEQQYYSVVVNAYDTDGSLGFGPALSQLFILTLTNVNEFATDWVGAPPAGIAIPENNAAGLGPILFNATDGDAVAVTYSLEPSTDSAPNDAAYFSLDANTGGLYVKSSLNFEDSHGVFYSVIINATSLDGSPAISTLYVLTVTDVAVEPTQWEVGGNPTGNAGEVLETIAIGTSLADFNATDPEGTATLSYSVQQHDNAAYFEINSEGVLTTRSGLDFETQEHYSVIVQVQSDDGSPVISQHFVLTVTDVDNTRGWADGTPDGITLSESLAIGVEVVDINAVDAAGGGSITFGISGTDADYFNIGQNNGVITFASVLDFENPANADNRYSVIITANATIEGTEITRTFILTIANAADEDAAWVGTPPTGISIAENNAENLGPIVFNATDGDGAAVTYSLSGDDAVYFNIDANTGGLFVKSVLDYEDPNHTATFYNVIINATSLDGSTISTLYVLSLGDVDEATQWEDNGNPTGNTVSEVSTTGVSVADFGATDGDGSTVTYSLGGDQSSSFAIDSNGTLTTSSGLDFETSAHYTVIVLAKSLDDSPVLSHSFVLTVTNIADEDVAWTGTPPTGISISENNPENHGPIGFNATDGDGAGIAVTYSLSGDDAVYFNIDTNTGDLYVKSVLDYEDPNHTAKFYNVIINATSLDGSTISTLYVLSLGDVLNEPAKWEDNGNPTGNTISEVATIGVSVADFNAIDDDAGTTVNYSLGGDQGGSFAIDSEGILTTKSGLDFETFTHYSVIVKAQSDDAAGRDGILSQLFILTITDVNNTNDWASDTPTGKALNENRNAPIALDHFDNNDAPSGVTITYAITGGDTDYFNMELRSNGLWRLNAISSFDFENPANATNLYSVIITANADKEGDAISRTYILTINDVNETPIWEEQPQPLGGPDYIPDGTTPRAFALAEGVIGSTSGAAANTQVAKFKADDPDADDQYVTYGVTGTDAAYFNIDTNGRLFLTSNLDFENNSHGTIYSVVVVADTTTNGNPITTLFVISLTDANDPAVWTSNGNPSGATISENLAIGTSVANFNATDIDVGSSLEYSISGDDAKYFNLNATSGELTTVSTFNYEDTDAISQNHRYSITVSVDDVNAANNDAATTQIFVLTIGNVNEFSTDWQTNGNPSGITGSENNAIGVQVADFNATDGDYGVAVTYSLSSGGAADYFNINAATGALTAASSFNYESTYGQGNDNRYSVVVNATSTDGSTAITQTFILTIGDVDDGNRWITTPPGFYIVENNTVGATVGTFQANSLLDPNLAISYSLKSGNDHTYFSINADSGVLSLRSSVDYEDQTHYSVLVQADNPNDSTVATISQLFILSVGDINDNPITWASGGNPSGREINEVTSSPSNNYFGAAGVSLADFNAMDADSGTTISYSLTALTDFVIDSTTGVLRVRPDQAGNDALNYESISGRADGKAHVSMVVNAHSSDGSNPISQLFVLTIIDQVEPPQWITKLGDQTIRSGFFIYENNEINDNIPSNNLIVNTNEVTFEIVADKDGAYFNVTGSGGAFAYLNAKSVFDYESQDAIDHNHRYSVTVRAFNNSGEIFADYVLTIRDVNPNTIIWNDDDGENNSSDDKGGNPSGGSIDEVTAGGTSNAGTNLGNFDLDGERVGSTNRREIPADLNIEYTISGTDAAYFSINAADGRLYTKSDFDYEDATHGTLYSVVINATASVDAPETHADTTISRVYVLTVNDVDFGGLAPDAPTPDQPVGWNGKILFDGTTATIGGVNDGIGNDGLVIIGDNLTATQYDNGGQTDLVLNNIENFEQSFVGYTDADGNDQNHWFFVRDDAEDNTGHIVFDADGLDVNLESLANGGATTTPDQINLLAALNFGNDGDFNKPDDLNLDLNGNNAASLTHDQFLALIGGSNNIDFV